MPRADKFAEDGGDIERNRGELAQSSRSMFQDSKTNTRSAMVGWLFVVVIHELITAKPVLVKPLTLWQRIRRDLAAAGSQLLSCCCEITSTVSRPVSLARCSDDLAPTTLGRVSEFRSDDFC